MTIRKAAPGDLSRIMDIYHAAQEFMIRSGNPDQWAHIYPTEALVREDIQRGICHVVCDGEAIHGVFALMSGDEPTYQYIEGGTWLNDAPYLTVHRVASDGTAHGIFSRMADYCKGLSDDVRIDTHHKNLPMQRQIEKNGFVRCGTIYVEDGSPRIAYHWTSSNIKGVNII